MGKRGRQKSTSKVGVNTENGDSSRSKRISPHLPPSVVPALAQIPRPLLLELRRDLALTPLHGALRVIRDSYSEVANQLDALGAKLVADALAHALTHCSGDVDRQLHCWAFDIDADKVDKARLALGTLLPDGRSGLLSALRTGSAFCGTVTKHMGRIDSIPLLKLGRHRAMWLLGANPEEPMMSERSAAPAKRARRGKQRCEGEDEEVEAEDSEEEGVGEDRDQPDHEGTRSATLDFLATLREKKRLKKS